MEKLLNQIANRYEAVRVMAKEARRINRIIKAAGEEIEDKPTSIAMRRMVEGKVKYSYEQQEEEE